MGAQQTHTHRQHGVVCHATAGHHTRHRPYIVGQLCEPWRAQRSQAQHGRRIGGGGGVDHGYAVSLATAPAEGKGWNHRKPAVVHPRGIHHGRGHQGQDRVLTRLPVRGVAGQALYRLRTIPLGDGQQSGRRRLGVHKEILQHQLIALGGDEHQIVTLPTAAHFGAGAFGRRGVFGVGSRGHKTVDSAGRRLDLGDLARLETHRGRPSFWQGRRVGCPNAVHVQGPSMGHCRWFRHWVGSVIG